MTDETPTVDAAMVDATPVTANPAIMRVPLELLLRITWHLNTPELGKWRLACRFFAQAVDVTFIKEFFSRKQFMITEDSLQALVDISKSRFAPHLQHVHIGLDRLPEHLDRSVAPGGAQRQARHCELTAGQIALWASGHHRDMLAEAFRNLPNLETVVIRDFNSTKRSRDGPHIQWTSYGATTVFQETGIQMSQSSSGTWPLDWQARYSSMVLLAVLYALGQAGSRPKGIEVMSRQKNHLQSFGLHVPHFMEALVLPVLENLEALHIDVNLTWKTEGVIMFGRHRPTGAEMEDPMIRQFLLNCPNLKHLRINEDYNTVENVGLLLEWLARDPNAPLPPPPSPADTPLHMIPPWVPSPAFSHLEELNLGSMNVRAPWVLDVIRKFAPTLKRITLWKMTIRRKLPNPSVQIPPKTSFWSKFLESLKELPLDLRHIKIGSVMQKWEDRPDVRVSFDGNVSMEYTGANWKYYIDDILPLIKVEWPERFQPRVLVESDDESDDNDGIWEQYALDL